MRGLFGYSVDKAKTNNYVFSVIFIEDTQNNFIKISLRSKDGFDVNEFSRKHFNGGGHMNAAGGRSDLPIQETLDKFQEILKEYQAELNAVVL